MTAPRQGEVWFADLSPNRRGEIGDEHPVLVLSLDRLAAVAGIVIGVPCTTSVDHAAGRVGFLVSVPGRPDRRTFALHEQARSLSTDRFRRRIHAVSEVERRAVVRSLVGLLAENP